MPSFTDPPRVSAAPGPTAFRCEVTPDRDRVLVVPRGEVDLLTAPQLSRTVRELIESGFDQVVVDLASVDFLDSTGLHALLSQHALAQARGRRLSLRPGPPEVQRLFELTGTLDRLDFEKLASVPRRGFADG